MFQVSTTFLYFGILAVVSAHNQIKISLKTHEEHRSNLLKHLKGSGDVKHQKTLTSDGHEYLENFEKTIFYGEISIGTPWKIFTTIIDTTQSDVLVPSISCGDSCGSRERYDSSESSSYIKKDKLYNSIYRGKNITGFQSADSISFADYQIDSQGFVEVTNISDSTFDKAIEIDVITGFGFKEHSINGVSNPYWRIVEDLEPTYYEFAIFYGNDTELAGEITIGYSDSRSHTPNIVTYQNLIDKTYWIVKMDYFLIGSLSWDSSSHVQIDTASAFITGPTEEVSLIAKELGAWEVVGMPGFYSIECNFSLPDFHPTLGGINYYSVPSGDYLTRIDGTDTCLLGIVGRDLVSPIDGSLMWSFGDVFLRGHYSIFNSYNGRIGFSPLN